MRRSQSVYIQVHFGRLCVLAGMKEKKISTRCRIQVFFVLSVLSVLAPLAVGWLKLGGFRPEIAADAPSWLARINPFEGLVILLARGAGAALPYLPSLLILGLTLIGGRVWCGWICPMGTLFSLFGRNGRTHVKKMIKFVAIWNKNNKMVYNIELEYANLTDNDSV